MALPKIIRNMDAADTMIRERKPFQTRPRRTPYGDFVSMSGGDWNKGHVVSLGRDPATKEPDDRMLGWGYLPREYRDSVGFADYVVYSYDTPIGWHHDRPHDLTQPELVETWLADGSDGVWLVPDVKYTTTTTQHQSNLRAALGGYGYQLYARNADGTVDYSSRAPALPTVPFTIPGAPAKVEGISVERRIY